MTGILHFMRTIQFLSHKMASIQQPIPLILADSFSILARYCVFKFTIIFNSHNSLVGKYDHVRVKETVSE